MPHDHHGGHEHAHPQQPDLDAPLTRWQAMEIALRELLIEKGALTAAEIADQVQAMDSRGEHLGAQVVARAWTDPEFKAALLNDGSAACHAIGLQVDPLKLLVVENTDTVHNMIVCTLCSCYPRLLLGPPPDWYKERAYRSRAVREPRKVLAEFGMVLPDGVALRVHDSTADMRYLVLPRRPDGLEEWPASRLEKLVTRDSLIGVGALRDPTAC